MMVRVMIVDDDISFCRRIQKSIDKTFEVIFAHDCKQALKACAKDDIDLVLATLDMPNDQLSQMIGVLRDHFPETRIIAMSENMKDETFLNAMMRVGGLGVNRIIQHPFAAKDIHRAVDQELVNCVSLV